ncbi:uncharacterized protein LOC127712979 [Mytilus californianus]|uniref:uncharacterized protein LOC127712979 n=1 Tax=Mytilus californianus TaxID=6549 RepID=UPI0022465CD2|nr:uncharacterized protein LOC127712979 [Mytilus californianus]
MIANNVNDWRMEKLLVFTTLLFIGATATNNYWTYEQNEPLINTGSLGNPGGCQCSCEPAIEPRRGSGALSTNRRRRRKNRRRQRQPVIPEVIPQTPNFIERGSRGIRVTDPIPETRGLGGGIRAPVSKTQRRIGVGDAVLRGVAGFEGGAPSSGVLQPEYRFDNGHDNGFVDNGFDNGIHGNAIGIDSNVIGGSTGFPTEVNGGFGTDTNVGFVGDPNVGQVTETNGGIQGRFNGDGFSNTGNIRQGSWGSKSRRRHRKKYKY